jgi:hypothetical protein
LGNTEDILEEARGLAKALSRRLDAVSEVKQRSHLIAQYCASNEPEMVSMGLQAVMSSAMEGRGRDAWLAVVIALLQDAIPYDRTEEIYRASVESGRDGLRMVLLAGDHTRRKAKEGEFDRDDMLESLPLGRRKAKARQMDMASLNRLLYDPDPSVTRILLGNPRITEAHVMRLAARRPNRSSTLTEIAIVPRWVCRAAIQRALVLNPYTPVKIGVSLSPLLGVGIWRELVEDKNLHPMVGTMARTLLRLVGDEPPVFH